MSQNIEIEFKNLLTESEFMQLKSFLDIDNSMFIKQENHYFDTANFSLKELGCALRIRSKKGRYELTLKEPHLEGLLETNQMISEQEATEMLENNVLIEGPVKERLVEHHIPHDELVLFGTLSTNRAEKEFQGGLIVLDHSTYLNQFDYELEYEVSDFQKGREIFDHLLNQLNIPIRTTENKIRRFYQAKFNQK